MSDMAKLHSDADLIEKLGGAAELARRLNKIEGSETTYDVQRVTNWKTRGIPAAVKLAHPDLFLPDLQRKQQPGPDDSFDPDQSIEPSC